MQNKRILITPGEPAGIGPDITVQIAQLDFPQTELVVIANPTLLQERAKQLNLPLELIEADLQTKAAQHEKGSLKILPVPLIKKIIPGQLDPIHASYVINTLKIAADLCLKKKAHAIVTGPVHKAIINQAGISFKGHTEFFAEQCGVSHTVMLFVVDQIKTLRVALATTHLPLKSVSCALTKEHLRSTLVILHQELEKKFNLFSPHIFVAGLNPHAGESGLLGQEEIEVMNPVIEELRAKGVRLTGPLPADTLFTPKYLDQADAILAMYHDQGLPLVKYMGFGKAVNVTLGLPFIRTSVDHGTALDIAGTPYADAGSLEAAIRLAAKIS